MILEADASRMTAGMAQGARSVKGFQGSVTASAKLTTSALGVAVPLAATTAGVALGAFAVQSFKAARDYDAAFTRISAISNASADDIERWRGEVMDLAGETAQAPLELADALFYLSSAGLESGQVMEALTASAKASAVGLGSTVDVANITASALNAYADAGLTAAQVTDTLVAAVREGRAEPEAFAGALGRILPIAAQAGVSFDEVTASLAGLSNIGLDVDEAVTAMRGALQAIAAPGSQAAEAMDQMGLSAQDLLDAISQDGLFGAFQLLDKAAKATTDTQAEYIGILRKVIPNVRALTGVMGLTGQEAEKVQAIFDAVADSSGSLGEAFAVTADSDAFKLKQAMNDLSVVGQELATAFLPLIRDLVGALGPLLSVIEAVTPAVNLLGLAFAKALSPIKAMIDALIWLADKLGVGVDSLFEAGAATDVFREAIRGTIADSARWTAQADAYAAATDGVTRANRDAAASARDLRQAQLALAGGLLGVIAQANELQDAQAELTRLQEHGARGTERYREATMDVLGATLSLQQGLIDYGVELRKSGESQRSVVATLRDIGRESGLTKGDIADLLDEVASLTGNLARFEKGSPYKAEVDLDAGQALTTVENLYGRLHALEVHNWKAVVQVYTEGGSTGFELIEELRRALDDLETRPWEVKVLVTAQGDLQALVDALADVVGDKLPKAWLRAAKALGAAASDLESRLTDLFDRIDAFRQDIASGFDIDLVGGLVGFREQWLADQRSLLEQEADIREQLATATTPEQVAGLQTQLGEITAQLGEFADGIDASMSNWVAAQVAQAQTFGETLQQLAAAGLSQANIAELAGQGVAALPFAQALLANPELIGQLNEAQKLIAQAQAQATKALVEQYFGPELERAAEKVARFRERLEGFVQGLGDELAELGRRFDDVGDALERLVRRMGGQPAPSNPAVGGLSGPGGAGPSVTVNVQGWVGNDQQIAEKVRAELLKMQRYNLASTGIKE